MPIDQEKLAKLQAASRTGGKGAPRRKAVKKPKGAVAGGDDKKLQAALKKLNVEPVTGIEEVNMFKEDGNVLHIANPKGTLRLLHSARRHHLEHARHLRPRAGQGAHSARARYPQPAGPRLAREPAQAR